MENEDGIYIGEPEEKKLSEMPMDYQEQVKRFFEKMGIPCPPMDSIITHIGPW